MPTPPFKPEPKQTSREDARGMSPFAIAALIIGGGVALLAIVVVGGTLVFGLVFPVARQVGVSNQRQVSAARLVQIGQALSAYADANAGAFPERGANLASRLAPYSSNPQLLHPPGMPPSQVWFHYVPGWTKSAKETEVLLYEDPAATDGSGGVILHVSLFHEFVAQPEYSAKIDAITLSDGTRWTPHIPGWVPPAP